MRTLKLLLTNKYYRWAILERLKLKILSLPGIKHFVAWNYAYKMHKKMKNMDQWEQYVEMREIENNSKKFCFIAALIRLKAGIMAKDENEELFQQAKADILSNEIINEPICQDFKKWLINIDSNEQDYSKVEELINSFTKKTQ